MNTTVGSGNIGLITHRITPVISILLATLFFVGAPPLRAGAQSPPVRLLHSFQGDIYLSGNVDGADPFAGLILSGNTLYGSTTQGGAWGNGTIFRMNTDGTGFTNLYSFTPTAQYFLSGLSAILTNHDGARPVAGLILSGNTLYGAAQGGGDFGFGTIFKINTDGSGFATLYSFKALDFASGTNSDGANPLGSLILSGNTLYGTASVGGISGGGTVFSINADGSGFRVLYSFNARAGEGINPHAGLVLSGDILYGTTSQGGSLQFGTAFSISTNGSGFRTVYNFTGGGDGYDPEAGLIQADDMLYGSTAAGGASGNGVIFGISTNGSVFSNLYSFTASAFNGYTGSTNEDGAAPYGSLIFSGGILYGTTSSGGTLGAGTVFSISTNGSGFKNLKNFGLDMNYIMTNTSGSFVNGMNPKSALVLAGNTLIGTAPGTAIYTNYNSSNGDGAVFQISTDGSSYTNLHVFSTPVPYPLDTDGAHPFSGLTLSGNTLYGTTDDGGNCPAGQTGLGYGTVFRINTDGAGLTNLYLFSPLQSSIYGQTNNDGANPYAGVVLSGDTLYGTTLNGGEWGNGTIFSIRTNGSDFTVLHTFTAVALDSSYHETNGDGAAPYGGLTLSGGTFYGTTEQGGGSGRGTVFSMSTNGTGFTTLYSFTALNTGSYPSTNTDGATPYAGVIIDGNTLYGPASAGGQWGNGTIFSLNTNGSDFTVLHAFTALSYSSSTYTESNSDGVNPQAKLLLSGGTLYGTALTGGSWNLGTVFSLGTNGSRFMSLYSFSGGLGTNPDGAEPAGGLILSGNTLYGTTDAGSTIFEISTDGSGYTNLCFLDTQLGGKYPFGELVLSDSTLYGMTECGANWIYTDGGFDSLTAGGTVYALDLANSPATPPAIELAPFGNQVVFSWPASVPYLLETSPALGAGASWTPIYSGIITNGSYCYLTNSTSGRAAFFRLHQQ